MEGCSQLAQSLLGFRLAGRGASFLAQVLDYGLGMKRHYLDGNVQMSIRSMPENPETAALLLD